MGAGKPAPFLMARGDHFRNPVIKNADAQIQITLFVKDGRQMHKYLVKDFMSNTTNQQRSNLWQFFKECLESKLGKRVNELPLGSQSGSEN